MNRRAFLRSIPWVCSVPHVCTVMAWGRKEEEDLLGAGPQFFRWISLEGRNQQLAYEDPWDPAFQSQCRKILRQHYQERSKRLTVTRSSPSQVPIWDLTRSRLQREMDWVSFIRQLSRDAPGKQVYVRFLLNRYGQNLHQINQRYGSGVTHKADLLDYPFGKVDWQDRAIFQDDQVFLKIIRNRWSSELKSLQVTAYQHRLHLAEKTDSHSLQSRFAII